jgi:hypothetical protein
VDITVFGIYGQSRPDSGDVGLTGRCTAGGSATEAGRRRCPGAGRKFARTGWRRQRLSCGRNQGTPDVIQSIERLVLEVASLIDEYTKSSFMGRYCLSNVTYAHMIFQCVSLRRRSLISRRASQSAKQRSKICMRGSGRGSWRTWLIVSRKYRKL